MVYTLPRSTACFFIEETGRLFNSDPSEDLLRIIVSIISLCMLAACASTLPEGGSYYNAPQATTGSNITHHSSDAVSYDKSAVEDALRRGPAGAPSHN
jgi:hypothetical protein